LKASRDKSLLGPVITLLFVASSFVTSCSTDAIASSFLGVFHGYHFICRCDVHTKETFASLRTKFFK
jgi:hypothetical protein